MQASIKIEYDDSAMIQLTFFPEKDKKLLNLKEAGEWASKYLNRSVAISNVSYLIQCGRINRYGNEGNPLLNVEELKDYYDSLNDEEKRLRETLGDDLNWRLSFAEYTQAERTKHVHGLHPYKGKFIPQLAEYFLDSHTDEFKREVYFHEGDIVLDPFCGSGTTLVQANELGMHAVGIDVSAFNALIANVKVGRHNPSLILNAIHKLSSRLKEFRQGGDNVRFEERLLSELTKFNSKYFPSPEYKKKVVKREIDEDEYAVEKENEFLEIYHALAEKYRIKITREKDDAFLDRWFLPPVREEIDFLADELKTIINDEDVKRVLTVILSRTIRSCRATTHTDLGALKEPVATTYYCKKHRKICKPIFSIADRWRTYAADALNRLVEFNRLRTDTQQICLMGDSRTIDILEATEKLKPELARMLSERKIRGVFSSPPYVGLIAYHEQHAYAYETFGIERKDESEIGHLFNGRGKKARESYTKDMAEVLKNCKKHLQPDYDVFLVANDKFNLYPDIAESAGMKIVGKFRRPVLKRMEKYRNADYEETIFHLKEI